MLLIFNNIYLAYSQFDSLLADCNQRNEILFKENLKNWNLHLDKCLKADSGVMSIVHFGDSHIQADFLTGRTRERMQSFFGNGGRGFVFPYSLVNTNGSTDLLFDYSGNWSYCKLKLSENGCLSGLGGFSLNCDNSDNEIIIDFSKNAKLNYSFNECIVIGRNQESSYCIPGAQESLRSENCVTYQYEEPSFSFWLKSAASKVDNISGFSFHNNKPGIIYHSMGINGANSLHLAQSTRISSDIALLNPNLIILSFGTNDVYVPESSFDVHNVIARYKAFVTKVKSENPQADILLTTPPSHYYKRLKPNKNIEIFNQSLLEFASDNQLAVWDLYNVMGGAKSVKNWQEVGFARGDLIHFTKEGYYLQGELLFRAILEVYESQFN